MWSMQTRSWSTSSGATTWCVVSPSRLSGSTGRHNGRKVTNYEMESAPLQGLGRLMGHRAMTVCSIIANRMNTEANPNYKTAVYDLVGTVLDRI